MIWYSSTLGSNGWVSTTWRPSTFLEITHPLSRASRMIRSASAIWARASSVSVVSHSTTWWPRRLATMIRCMGPPMGVGPSIVGPLAPGCKRNERSAISYQPSAWRRDMQVCFLDPLEERLKEFPARYLADHRVRLADGHTDDVPPDTEALITWSG